MENSDRHRRRPGGPDRRRHLAERRGDAPRVLEAKAHARGPGAPPSARRGSTSTRARTRSTSAAPAMRELTALGVDPPRWNPVARLALVLIRDGAGPAGSRPRSGASLRLLRAGRAAVDARARVARRRTSTTRRTRELAGALVRVTTFVADHDALPADVAARQLRARRGPASATSGAAGSGSSTRSPPRPSGAARPSQTRAAVRALERGRRSTVDDETILRRRGRRRRRAAGASEARAGRSSPPGPPARGLLPRPRPARAAEARDRSRSASTSRRTTPGTRRPAHEAGVLMTAMSYAAAPTRGSRADRRHRPPGLARPADLRTATSRGWSPVSAVASPDRAARGRARSAGAVRRRRLGRRRRAGSSTPRSPPARPRRARRASRTAAAVAA